LTAKNPYTVLGVAPSAGDAEIRAAFRKLAKRWHPDRNREDKSAEEKFKEISAAFDVVGDPERRKRFDRGEIDAEGKERGAGRAWSGARPGADGFGYYQGGQGGQGGPGAGASYDDIGDIFADLFGSTRAGRGANSSMRGRDLRYRLEVDFLDAMNGATKRVTMPDGRTLDLTIPSGIEDGQTLRLKGQGEKGPAGGPAGDVFVEMKVKSDPVFRREGADIHIEAPITLKEAVLGGKITVPTITGDVAVSVPRNTSSGAVLRLKGRGAPTGKAAAGDQYVKLKIMLPEGGDAELENFVKSWKGGDRQPQPRKKFAGA
jgi:DnaJ-class molecular chaperone